uniref:Fzd-5/8-3 n=1 Tax=Schmidtea mediterranea TaxID=79327 RepID=T1DF42_SCHMD|nr:hypothetical protein Smed-fzd-5/8-3 [Schmidtea mediterranea]
MFKIICLSWKKLLVFILLKTVESSNSDFYPLKSDNTNRDKGKCEIIKIPMCKDIHYNMTMMPNMFNHENQDEAGFEAHQFYPLVQIKCSEDLQFFLCSIYTPICLKQYVKSLPPCRSVCERVKKGCDPLLQKYTFKWPEKMNCDQFPVYNNPEKILCMEKNLSTASTTLASVVTLAPKEQNDANSRQVAEQNLLNEVSYQLTRQYNSRVFCQCSCRKPLIDIAEINKAHFNRVSTLGMFNCAQGCKSPFFSSESDQKFIGFWLGLWTIICLLSTFSIVATFSIDPGRYRYPERPIIFMSICYFMVSLGFLIRIVMGHEDLACDLIKAKDGSSLSLLRYGGSGPAHCTIVFLLIYYFGMAASLWWVLLTITWFLAAGLKWGSEAISKYSQIYHFLAWFLPGIKSIVALTMSAVDGDPVSGICYVGNTSDFNLILFVLSPLLVYLTIGTLVLISGFASLFRIRSIIKLQTGGKTEKLEKLMIRIGVFSVLYTAPAAVIVACIIYELQNRAEWYQNLSCDCFDSNRHQLNLPRPSYSVFMFKYFMFMGVGMTSGFWIWSKKTILSWKMVCYRLGINSCHVEERNKHTSLAHLEIRNGALLRNNNNLGMDNGSCNSQLGGTKSSSGVTHCPYTHSHPSSGNLAAAAAATQNCFMSQSQMNHFNRPILSAPSAPLPTPPQSSGQSTPPPLPLTSHCITQQQNQYIQHIHDSKESSYLPFITSHDTNPSCYFSSSGARSNASSALPINSIQFPVIQL